MNLQQNNSAQLEEKLRSAIMERNFFESLVNVAEQHAEDLIAGIDKFLWWCLGFIALMLALLILIPR